MSESGHEDKRREQKARERKQRRRKLMLALQGMAFAVAASVVSLVVYWYAPPLLDYIDQRARDVVFRLREAPPPPPEVVVVSVDEKSVKTYGRWPWPREVQARLLSRLKDYGVGTMALDIIYTQPPSEACGCPNQDEALIATLQAEGAPVVGGYFFRDDKTGETSEQAIEILEHSRIRMMMESPGATLEPVRHYEFVETNQDEIAAHYAALGSFNRVPDGDGMVRTAPLIMEFDGKLYPSLALAGLSTWAGARPGIVVGPQGVESVKLLDVEVPVDSEGKMTVNFYDLDRPIPIISAADVLDGTADPQVLFDTLVFVGVTEIGIADLVSTPIKGAFPGVGVHATVAANILQQFFLVKDMDVLLIDTALIALVPLILVLVMIGLKKAWQQGAVFALFVTGLGYLFIWLVGDKGLLVSVVYPTFAVVIAFVTFQVYYTLTSQRKNRFLTDAFSSYVTPALVDRLVTNPDELSLTGEKREISILFSDIRSFTTISEGMDPIQLVEMLNYYLGEMTELILDRDGTLDKYIGDAIMAIFNAPLDIADHPAKAADSALQMIYKLEEIKPVVKERYGVDMAHGVGVHVGEVIVGNLGSQRRFDYTAIGDSVNLGARLESATKQYGVDILISEALEERLGDEFLTRKVDNIRVKGKHRPVKIYELMSHPDEPRQRELAEKFGQALSHYLDARFAQAEKDFAAIAEQFPDDMPSQLYLERARAYTADPPGPDWDGVYVATSK